MVAGGYRKTSDLPGLIPVFPLDHALLLPGCALPLQIFEPRYLNMVDDAMSGDRMIGMIQTRGGTRQWPRLARVGCAGRITSYAETGDGKYLITLTGVCRFEVGEELTIQTPYRQVRAGWELFATDLEPLGDEEMEFDRPPFLDVLRRYLDHRGLGIEWDAVNAAPALALVNSLAMGLPFDVAEKQALLEAPSLDARRAALAALLEIDAADLDDDEPPALQ